MKTKDKGFGDEVDF